MATVCLLGRTAAAQNATAELRGRVVDEQQAVLPNVLITVRHQDSGTVRTTRSGKGGDYFVGALTPGRHEIRASLKGFRPLTRPAEYLEVGRTTIVDLTMFIGSIAESVLVDAPPMDTTSTAGGGHITGRDLIDLPSLNRSFVGFIGLLPGIVPISSDAFGADAVSVNGVDPRHSNYLLDGASNTDDFIGQRAGMQARTPIEAIQEFQVLTHQFDAEFGRATGAVINAVIRQGSNEFHGSAFSFFQDDALTAREYFALQNRLPKPTTQQQQFGGTAGGPIVRNHAHFFASLEAVRSTRAATINIPPRPDLTTTTTMQGRAWNTVVRVDQQLGSQRWGVRWLRESSPQENLLIPAGGRQVTLAASREEDDIDQTAVATWHSVFGNTRVNTLRLAFTRENVAFANPGFNRNDRRQDLLPPTLQYQTFIDQQSDVAQARINNGYSLEDTFSWFIPDRHGDHELKLGVQYQAATVDSTNQGMLNGLFEFRGNTPFNPADLTTYPERLQIRVPGGSDFFMSGHFVSAFAQDKWRFRDLTLSLGLRYDVEAIPLREEENPAFASDRGYPLDWNNLAPRVGFAYPLDPANRSVLRGGYGVFYDRTAFELLAPFVTSGKFSDSFIASFPANGVDAGPSLGQLPAERLLRNGPTVDRALIRQLFPAGVRIRNAGTVYFDSPARTAPKTHQVTVGYARQVGNTASARVDFVHASGRDLLVSRDLNPGLRADTRRTSEVNRVNTEYVASVLQPVNEGRVDYDALEVQIERRFRGWFGARLSYTLGYSRGNTSGNGSPQLLLQRLDDLRLAANDGPTDFDRRHNLVISGTARVPRTGGLTVSAIARAMSGAPFSLIDSSADDDRNGILFDLLPRRTYLGIGPNAIRIDYDGRRNGAYGPGSFQLDMRAGYRLPAGDLRALDLLVEIFNVTNAATFDNPATAVQGHAAADRRMSGFLQLRALRPGTIPRTGQIGIRFGF